MQSSFRACLSPWDDLGAGGANSSGPVWIQESSGELDRQVSFPDLGLVLDLDLRRSGLVQGQGVEDVGFKSARPAIINGESMVEITNVAGRKRLLNCNWLAFCAGMVKRGQGSTLKQAFPELSKEDFEFLTNGITNKEWEAVFGKEEEECPTNKPQQRNSLLRTVSSVVVRSLTLLP